MLGSVCGEFSLLLIDSPQVVGCGQDVPIVGPVDTLETLEGLAECGLRLRILAFLKIDPTEASQSHEGRRIRGAQSLPAGIERLLLKLLGLFDVALFLSEPSQTHHDLKGLQIIRTERPAA
jgi:hypothetical protein